MKILAVADEESKSLWDFWDKSKLEGVDVLYIHRNHDTLYSANLPEGCICIDTRIINAFEKYIFEYEK